MTRPASAETWPAPPAVVWNDVENGGYDADRTVWLALAERTRGPVLEVGAGTGRVALVLAAAGHEVTAVDLDDDLLQTLCQRADERGLRVDAALCDARALSLDRMFGLILAPMQLIQLLGGRAARIAFFRTSAAHLLDDGLVAVAVTDELATEGSGQTSESSLPLPDMREIDGWVFSSLVLPTRMTSDDRYEFRRLRTAVSPDGATHESWATVSLDSVARAGLLEEAAAAGLFPSERVDPVQEIPAIEGYVASTVLAFERSGRDDER